MIGEPVGDDGTLAFRVVNASDPNAARPVAPGSLGVSCRPLG